MKKIFTLIAAIAVLVLSSCTKDGGAQSIYSNTITLENVGYFTSVSQNNGVYSWTVKNTEPEQSKTFIFNYNYKSDLSQDLASVLELMDNLSPLASDSYIFRFNNTDMPVDALITKETVKGKVIVDVKLLDGDKLAVKTFRLPYDFLAEAYDKLNPKN